MKKIYWHELMVIATSAALFITGCGGGAENVASEATPSPTPSSTSVNLTGGTVAETKREESIQVPIQPVVEFEAGKRTTTEAGQQISDLDLLNRALETYAESRANNVGVRGSFQSEAEQMAAEAKALEASRKPIADLQELVRAGVIRSVPQAPAGKKYVIDPKTGKVVMTNA